MLLKGKNIFIVEDQALNRVVYRITLTYAGARLEFNSWGQDVIFALRKQPKWDLIILDLMLSKSKSGYEVFQEIRELTELSGTPIIAISASDPDTAIPMVKELGFSGFISKPVNEDLLAQQLLRIIQGESIWIDGSRGM